MTQPRPAEVDPRSRRQRRQVEARVRAEARERSWRDNRYAVPYDIDGPKVTLGVAWFAAVLAAALFDPLAVLAVTGVVAAVAAMQVAWWWRSEADLPRWLVGSLAILVPSAAAVGGAFGLGAGVVGATLVGVLAAVLSEARADARALRRAELTVRAAVPVGLAAGSLVVMSRLGVGPVVSLLLLVSAYEVGDFLIGTGSSNAVEGPLAGVVSSAVVGAVVVVASPLGGADPLVPAASAVVLAPVGQLAASVILPAGAAWAPALRRLDSYLLAAPLWVLLLGPRLGA